MVLTHPDFTVQYFAFYFSRSLLHFKIMGQAFDISYLSMEAVTQNIGLDTMVAKCPAALWSSCYPLFSEWFEKIISSYLCYYVLFKSDNVTRIHPQWLDTRCTPLEYKIRKIQLEWELFYAYTAFFTHINEGSRRCSTNPTSVRLANREYLVVKPLWYLPF